MFSGERHANRAKPRRHDDPRHPFRRDDTAGSAGGRGYRLRGQLGVPRRNRTTPPKPSWDCICFQDLQSCLFEGDLTSVLSLLTGSSDHCCSRLLYVQEEDAEGCSITFTRRIVRHKPQPQFTFSLFKSSTSCRKSSLRSLKREHSMAADLLTCGWWVHRLRAVMVPRARRSRSAYASPPTLAAPASVRRHLIF